MAYARFQRLSPATPRSPRHPDAPALLVTAPIGTAPLGAVLTSIAALVPPTGSSAAARPPQHRLALAACALVGALAWGSAVAQGAGTDSASPRSDAASSRPAQSRAPAGHPGAPTPAKRNLADELFTEAEREAWRQKIAAAPDEAQKRQLRGQRLAELQRRSREAKAAAGGSKPAPREAR